MEDGTPVTDASVREWVRSWDELGSMFHSGERTNQNRRPCHVAGDQRHPQRWSAMVLGATGRTFGLPARGKDAALTDTSKRNANCRHRALEAGGLE